MAWTRVCVCGHDKVFLGCVNLRIGQGTNGGGDGRGRNDAITTLGLAWQARSLDLARVFPLPPSFLDVLSAALSAVTCNVVVA